MVPKSSSIAQVMGVTNAVTIDGEGIPPITLVGPGAGGAATASAVVADIADVARGIRAKPFGRPVARLRETKKAPMERHEGGYYIRLMARDLPGTAATIATRLAEQKISIESIVQRHRDQSRLRNPQRHLQLHPDADGAGRVVVCGMSEGRAAPRLCRGQPVVRR